MKVLIGPANIAQQPMLLRNALRTKGIHADFVQYATGSEHYVDKYDFQRDRIVQFTATNRTARQAQFIRDTLDEGYDIYNMWMRTFISTPGPPGFIDAGSDVPFLKARGKRVVYRFTGFDARQESVYRSLTPYNVFDYGYKSIITEEAQQGYVRFLREYVDRFVVASHDIHDYVPESVIIPRIAELDKLPYVGLDNGRKRLLVAHVPSDTATKGTPIIQRAVAELQREGVQFDSIVLDKVVRHDELLELYKRSDIVIDQLCLGDHGVAAIEGMALGKPVLVYLRDSVAQRSGIPVVNVNPDTLKDGLREVLQDPELRQSLSVRGREYVEQVHHPDKVVAQWIALFEQVLRDPPVTPTGYEDLDWWLYQRTLHTAQSRVVEYQRVGPRELARAYAKARFPKAFKMYQTMFRRRRWQ